MNWSPQQEHARRTVSRWMRDPSAPQTLYLAGYAGSGKTTLAKDLVSGSNRKWLFAAYTGKAAHVLSTKGCTGARTIHSLIYRYAGEVSSEQLAEMRRELGSPDTPAPRRGQRVRDASEFDWGYALTVHKAQGSEWDRVLVIDESTRLGGTDPRRWLYTAVSRASEHVTVLT